MKKDMLPTTDSVQELAAFWDNHDISDYEDELVDVEGPFLVRENAIRVPLDAAATEAVEKMAKARGVSREDLVRLWVMKLVAESSITTSDTKS